MINQNTDFNFTEKLEILFYNSYKILQTYGCTYMYYTIIDKIHGRIRFSTDENWLNTYLTDGLVNDCPMKAASEQKISRILPWCHVPISCKMQKKVMDARKSFNIYNGINFINFQNNSHRILTLTTDCASHDLPKEIMSNIALLKQVYHTLVTAV